MKDVGDGRHAELGQSKMHHSSISSRFPTQRKPRCVGHRSAVLCGYLLYRYFPKLSTWAWIIPTFVMAYTLFEFTDAPSSVFSSPHYFTQFSYFFGSLTHVPRFSEVGSPDVIRTLQQMFVVAPFYSGLAYSVGALAAKHKVFAAVQFQSEIESSGAEARESGPASPHL